jgi:hypothetical protein
MSYVDAVMSSYPFSGSASEGKGDCGNRDVGYTVTTKTSALLAWVD